MYVVFDIGGTKTRMAVSGDGEALENVQVWNTPTDFEMGISKVAEFVKRTQKGDISMIGGGVAGVLDRGKKRLVFSPHLPNWINKPLGKELERIGNCPVRVENDAAMAALGEANVGAGRRYEIVAYLTVGTGIGGAKVVNGELESRTWGFEPGHQILDVNNQLGVWEDFASGSAMEKVYGGRPELIDDPIAWDNEHRLLALGIHNVIAMWSPGVVVIGGGLSAKIDVAKIKTYLSQQVKIVPELPDIKLAELGDTSGLYGSLKYLRHSSGVGGF